MSANRGGNSGTALRYLNDDLTMNPIMIALFQANVQVFDDNINVRYESAILRIQDDIEVRHHAPETARAEVIRKTKGWHAGY